jgi:hypothetical protein
MLVHDMIEATRGLRKHLGGDRRTQTLNGSLDYALRRELKLDGARSRRRIRQFLQAFHHASPLAPQYVNYQIVCITAAYICRLILVNALTHFLSIAMSSLSHGKSRSRLCHLSVAIATHNLAGRIDGAPSE